MLRDGLPIQARQRLTAGTVFEFSQPESEPELAGDPHVVFDVLFEDEVLAVVNKPAGVVVHPGAGWREGTLAAGLLSRWPEIAGVGEADRWGIVHRLDRDTSGLLVVAKTGEAHRRLSRALSRREITRTYLALVVGRPDVATGTIDAPIGRDPRRPVRRRVARDGRPARTHYRTLASWERHSLLEVTLETGRTHQIRVHLASIGFPVVNDPTYGRPGPGSLWLHSHRLRFEHPFGMGVIDIVAPVPEELSSQLAALGPPLEGEVPN
jgi:23S rRNA pseudouridine1911/1915/1917 synthase